jgi:hypothetical protein
VVVAEVVEGLRLLRGSLVQELVAAVEAEAEEKAHRLGDRCRMVVVVVVVEEVHHLLEQLYSWHLSLYSSVFPALVLSLRLVNLVVLDPPVWAS